MTLTGICTVSKANWFAAAVFSILRWIAGLLWPVKPMKRIFPAFFAATSASMAPSGPKTRSGSEARITSCTCKRSMTSVPSARRL